MQLPKISFYALPDSPHLTHSWCGYTLLSFAGFPEPVAIHKIDRITLNGMDQQFKPFGENALMIIPAFKQEAQRLKVFCKATSEPPSAPQSVRARVAPTEPTYGFTAPSDPYKGGL